MAFLVLGLLATLCVLQAFYYYPRLPQQVYAHFGESGRPDGAASKQVLLVVYLGACALSGLLVWLSSRVQRGLEHQIKLPNRDYWLAPERRQQTLDFLSRGFLWFAAATLALMIDLFHQVFEVNLRGGGPLAHPKLSLGLYVGFAVVFAVALQLRFRQPS